MEIPLANGRGIAIIDDEDGPRVSMYRWCLKKSPHDVIGYARAYINGCYVYMHQLLCDAPRVDHRNGNGLDNRKANLRGCTHAQNMRNQRLQKGRKYKGAHRTPGGKFRALIRGLEGKLIYLGTFATEEQAARAYDAAALRLFGEFAWLNFPLANAAD